LAINVIDKDGIFHIAIQGEMTIYTAVEQKNKLIECLKPDHELCIDLSAVSEIDSAGLQLLLWLKQEAPRLNLIHHSRAVVEVLELLNLASHFGDPIIFSSHWKTS
jgi:anti-anti-sigma factor